MSPSRRDLLKLAGLTLVTPPWSMPRVVARALAAPGAADVKFLLVFLRGGYDAANVVAPVGSDFYYDARPTLALARPDAANPQAALPLAAPGEAVHWGLHPALKDTLLPLWRAGELAFVPFAGTDDLSRSHFETQDSVEAGLPLSEPGRPRPAAGSGFLNRLATVLGGAAAPVAFTDGLPVVMSGEVEVPNVSLRGTGKPSFDDRQMQVLLSMYKGTRFEGLITEGFDLRKAVAEEADQMAAAAAASEAQAANRRALTATGFELEARRMAALLRDRFNLAFIDVGGWDTHVNQGGAQGALATLLTSLGQGLAGFADQLENTWRRTVVVVVSEFGRTFRENGTRGTDHGHGSVYWVLGGGVHGGRFVGDQVAVTPQTLNQSRDFPVLTDYRALLGGLFQSLYGLDAARLNRVFPGATPKDLGLV
jgi:uncharacterized protein (DUF1501 family)